jgi:hypothetical protein
MMESGQVTLHHVAGDGSAAVDVVFFHGLGGHYEKTWRHDQGFSWPHKLASEAASVRTWTLEYPAHRWCWTEQGKEAVGDITQIARRVRIEIVSKRREGLMQSGKPCIWVCHSLGGLVAKRLLVDNQRSSDAGDQLEDECLQGIMFLGTPHRGSDFADWSDVLVTVTKEVGQKALSLLAQTFGWEGHVPDNLLGHLSHLVKDLEDRNDKLWDLDGEFLLYFQNRWETQKKPLYVSVLAEGRSPFPGGLGPLVVDKTSADPRLRTNSNADPVEPILMSGLDHFELSKPVSTYSPQFRYLLDLRYRVWSDGGRYADYFRGAAQGGNHATFHLQRQLDQQIYRGVNFVDLWCELPAMSSVDVRSNVADKVVALVLVLAQGGDIRKIAQTSMAMATSVLTNHPPNNPDLLVHVDAVVAELLAYCAAPHSSSRTDATAHELVSYPGYKTQKSEAMPLIDAVFLRAAQAQHKSIPTILQTSEGMIALQDLSGLDPTAEPSDRLEQWVYSNKVAQTREEFAQQLSVSSFEKLNDYEKEELTAEVYQRIQDRRYLLVDAREGVAGSDLLSQFESSPVLPILSVIHAMPEFCAVEPLLKRAWENYATARSKHMA